MRCLALVLSLPFIIAVPITPARGIGPLGKTFGNAVPGHGFQAGVENELLSYSSTGDAALTHFWITGTPGVDEVVVRYYVDGEPVASIEYLPSLAAGVGWDDDSAPWGTPEIGKGAQNGAWFNNFIVPFSKSIRVTFEAPTNLTLWLIARGSENYPLVLRGVPLPPSARLQLHKVQREVQPLEYVDLAHLDAGSGLLYQTTLAVQSANLNYLEGCFRAYTSSSMSYPGVLLSTGTEDFFDSAYYFDAGEFHMPVSGFTHGNKTDGTFSAYRFFQEDLVSFSKGFSFIWRLGDTNDPTTGVKCTTQTGGTIVGSPQVSNVTAYTWLYVWPDGDDADPALTTIGTGLSHTTMQGGTEYVVFKHEVMSGSSSNALTHLWLTAKADADNVTVRYYVDGETEASVSMEPSLAAGQGQQDDTNAPWGTALFGQGASRGGWFINLLVPFGKSIVVSVEFPTDSTSYVIVRGAENMPLTVAGNPLPPSARLHLHKIHNMTLADFQFVDLVHVPSGAGLLLMTTMAVESGDLNFLEGCFHAYPDVDAKWPGVLLSTGTEDFFDSAYYFDAGEFEFPVSGLTHFNVSKSHASWSAYRTQTRDPIAFHRGFRLQWRNGDKTDAQSVKCYIPDDDATPRYGLTPSTLTSYAWTYEWPEDEDSDSHMATWGTGLSNAPVDTKETELWSHTVGANATHSALTHFWVTGTAGHDDTVVRYYVDGETVPSIAFTPAMAAATSFGDETAPWAAGGKVGKGAHTGAWWINYLVPFQRSIRITFQAQREGRIYAIVRGADNVALKVGNNILPSQTRLRLIETTATPAPLDYVTLASLPQGNGFVFGMAMAVSSTNLNFLEGCFRLYDTYATSYPGTLLSSGSEDYFDSAFYFDRGLFHMPVSGLTHINATQGATTLSAYRFHDADPLHFQDGFHYVWRNGETVPLDGRSKCLDQTGGKPIGTPGISHVHAYTWVYLY